MLRLLLTQLGLAFCYGGWKHSTEDWDFLHCNPDPVWDPELVLVCGESIPDRDYLSPGLTKTNIHSEMQKVRNMQMHGQCPNVIIWNRVVSHATNSDTFTTCEFGDCQAPAYSENSWRTCSSDFFSGPYCYGDWMDDARNPHLHVVVVIDMAVDDEQFWTMTMPNQLEAHLKSIPFVKGTTYEVAFMGPDGVRIQYPVWGTSKNRQRRSHCPAPKEHDGNGGCKCPSCTRSSGNGCVGCPRCDCSGGAGAEDYVQTDLCVITDRAVVMRRIRDVVSSVPSISDETARMVGLAYDDYWTYLGNFLPEQSSVLFLHALSRNHDMTPSQFNNAQNYLEAMYAAHPTVKIMNHYMFAESAVPFMNRLMDLGAGPDALTKISRGFTNAAATDALLGYLAVGGITDSPVVVSTSCSNSPCLNGCTCQQSCRDENDYVCVPQPGRPFVGKNCEWEATVQCTANRSIRISIPTAAINQYAIGVPNVIIQGCNNAPSYICNDMPSCGPAKVPVNGFYTLECANNQLVEVGGSFRFAQTFVFDRDSEVISMPRPIVKVECSMQTRPATSIITPQIRDPTVMTQTIFWQPSFQFYKTAWGEPMILANNGERLSNGAVAYIIGERVHVRLVASLNGVPPQSLPSRYEMELQTCSIASSQGGSSPILMVSNGMVVPNTPFPVSVDHARGYIGGGVPIESMGVAFSFQVFTFGAGASLQLTCSVLVKNARRKRSAEEVEDVTNANVVAELLIFEKGYDNDLEFPVLSIQQEPATRSLRMDRPGFGDSELEDVTSEFHSLSDLPVWMMTLFGLLVFLSVMVGAVFYRRNYVVKPHFDMDESKVRLFH